MAITPTQVKESLQTNYRIVDNTLSKEKVTDQTRRVEIEIGDIKEPDRFLPQFKTKHWDNEVNFSVRLTDDDYDNGIIRSLGDKIEWERDGRIARLYEKNTADQDGGFEFEVEMAGPPTDNIIRYTIQSKGLDFFYQGPLTQDEIAQGTQRPDNIIGSYAVYHQTRAHNVLGKNNYATGKAFHIYRPYIEDSNGVRVWCDLNIDLQAGEMTVTIPVDFLETAAYPVIVDPTFGYTPIGGTSVAGTADTLRCPTFQIGGESASVTGLVESIQFYGSGSSTNFKGVMTDASETILTDGVSPATAIAASAQWNISTYTTKPSVTSGTSYEPWVVWDSSSTYYYDITTGYGGFDSTNSYTTPTAPTDAITSGFRYSIYATYSDDRIVSVYDTVTVSESLSVVLVMSPSVYDTVTISEFIGYFDDTVFITESVSLAVSGGTPSPSVFDAVTVTENTSIITILQPNVFDSVGVVDLIENTIISIISISEDIVIVDVPSNNVTVSISVIDTVTVAEDIAAVLLVGVSLSVVDIISVTESLDLFSSIQHLSVYDSVGITETITIFFPALNLDVQDTVTVMESVSIVLTSHNAINDTVSVSEALTVLIPELVPSVFDSITTVDIVEMTIIGVIDGGLVEAISVTEDISMLVLVFVSVNDAVTIAENIALVIVSYESLGDDITVSEAVTAVLVSTINVNDTITITESIERLLISTLSISDTATVTESFSSEYILFSPQKPSFRPKGYTSALTGHTTGGGTSRNTGFITGGY